MSFYYLCSYPLGPGSIIQRGNWGRFLSLYQINPNTSSKLLLELIFERIRCEQFQSRPSRLKSNFVCPNLESAIEFRKAGRTFDLIYKVETPDATANSFETDWSLINTPINKTIIQVEEEARNYWRGVISNENKKEVIIDADIRILNREDV